MSEEIKIILEMLSAGKISVSEAEKLLEGAEGVQDVSIQPKASSKKFLRVLVVEGENTKVNINLPLALAEVGLKLVPKDKLKLEGYDINVDEIVRLIKDGSEGELVNIDMTEKGRDIKVKVMID